MNKYNIADVKVGCLIIVDVDGSNRTATVTGTGEKDGYDVVDFTTLDGDRHWAYLDQIVRVAR